MSKISFNSDLSIVTHLERKFTDEDVKNELMLFSASYEFARENGGIITKSFLDAIPLGYKVDGKLIIDSRVHMLMKGWYPCIPGWHHDDVERKGDKNQPNYVDPSYHAEHFFMVINTHICPTEFLIGTITLDTPEENEIVYDSFNKQINNQIFAGVCSKPIQVEDSTVYYFDWETFHRGTVSLEKGWRLFIRATRYSNDERFNERKQRQEIRKQTQVYLSAVEAGW